MSGEHFGRFFTKLVSDSDQNTTSVQAPAASGQPPTIVWCSSFLPTPLVTTPKTSILVATSVWAVSFWFFFFVQKKKFKVQKNIVSIVSILVLYFILFCSIMIHLLSHHSLHPWKQLVLLCQTHHLPIAAITFLLQPLPQVYHLS